MNIERAERALKFLAETDEKYADARVEVARAEYVIKRVEAREFLSEAGNIEERRSKARISKDYQMAVSAHTDALVTYERLKAKRQTETLMWEHWRSLEASRRQGG